MESQWISGAREFALAATASGRSSSTVMLITLTKCPQLPRLVNSGLDALQAALGALKRLQAETATELEALLPSVLDRAFKGDL